MTVQKSTLTITALLLLMTVCAQAQWVMVARAAAGQIQQMSNKSSNGGAMTWQRLSSWLTLTRSIRRR